MSRKIKKANIGGQALFEGVLMKGPYETAIAVRKPDGSIEAKIVERTEIAKSYKIFKYPFFRGIAALYDAIKNGNRAIDYSASFYEEKEKEGKSENRKKIEEFFWSVFSVIIFIGFIFLFFFVPTWISNLFRENIKSIFILNIIEGFIRVLLFLGYVFVISQQKDIKRVFKYHGAEHKAIACYENGEELTVENVKKYSRLHPRCGTSLIFNMVIISAILLSFLGWPNPIIRFLTRLLIIPVLVGLTFELNKWMGGSDNIISKIMAKPGILVQKMGTVKEPSDDMIEVAIESIKLVIPEGRDQNE